MRSQERRRDLSPICFLVARLIYTWRSQLEKRPVIAKEETQWKDQEKKDLLFPSPL